MHASAPITRQPRPPDYTSITETRHDFTTASGVASEEYSDDLEGLHQVPEDLLYLSRQSEVRILQQLDELDANHLRTTFERYNRYAICNSKEEAFCFAKESSIAKWRICTNTRPLTLDIKDNYGYLLLRLVRPYRCKAHWICCCALQELYIYHPVDTLVAHVREVWTPWVPELEISGQNGELLLIIRGEYFGSKYFCKQAFHVYNSAGNKVAYISKKVNGCTEWFAWLNDFHITFSQGVHALEKLIILGASFLVDMLYMEIKV